jgi:hypothetical protein
MLCTTLGLPRCAALAASLTSDQEAAAGPQGYGIAAVKFLLALELRFTGAWLSNARWILMGGGWRRCRRGLHGAARIRISQPCGQRPRFFEFPSKAEGAVRQQVRSGQIG